MNPVEFRDACLELRSRRAELPKRFFARRYAGEGWKAAAAAARWEALEGCLEDEALHGLLGSEDEVHLAALEAAAGCPLPEGGFDREALREDVARRLAQTRAERDAVRKERTARRGA